MPVGVEACNNGAGDSWAEHHAGNGKKHSRYHCGPSVFWTAETSLRCRSDGVHANIVAPPSRAIGDLGTAGWDRGPSPAGDPRSARAGAEGAAKFATPGEQARTGVKLVRAARWPQGPDVGKAASSRKAGKATCSCAAARPCANSDRPHERVQGS